jgi:hypothetical protein
VKEPPSKSTELNLEQTPIASAEADIAPSAAEDSKVTEPSQPTGDQRTAVRHCFGQRYQYLRIKVGPALWPAWVQDISASGIGFVLGIRYPPGTLLKLTVVDRSRDIYCPIWAQVMRVVRLPGGRWMTGCAFDEPLAADEVKALL